jgi:glycosyltransferase involved in cell wall biosynthesis
VGGPSVHVVLLSEAIHDTLLCFGDLSKGETPIWIRPEIKEKMKNINWTQIPFLQREISLIKDWKAFWGIRKIIKKYHPDIIHTHMAKAGFLGRLAGISANLFQKRKIKFVHTFHGHTFYGYFSNWKTYIFLLLEKWLSKRSTIICLSLKQKYHLVKKYKIVRFKNCKIIYLGLELDNFLKLPSPKPSSKFNVAIIGRLALIKNHKLLLDALKILKDTNSLRLYNFYIVGKGESEEELKEYSKSLGLGEQENIHWWGWEGDLAKFYHNENIHAVINTSLNEGTPVSLIEALVAGRQVICSDFDGAWEFLGGLENRFLFNKNDALSLISCLRIVYFLHKMPTVNERNLFYERYSFPQLKDKLNKLYEKLINKD